MADRVLVELPLSPWTERARWALDHHGLSWRRVVHAPFLGEGKLKKLRRGLPGKPTTPLLVDDGVVYPSSDAIARHADAIGAGAKLFPAGRDADVDAWIANAERGSQNGRVLITRRLLDSPGALDEQLPPFTPSFVRPLLRPVTRYGTRWFARKYDLPVDDAAAVAAAEAAACAALDAVRAALDGGDYLLGAFSFADIVSCLLLQAVQPVQHPKYPLLPATRAQWTAPHLVERYRDLLAWRDRLYARHR